jgi:hypothetical protein
LEATASASLTIFLTLNHARIARQETISAKRRVVRLIHLAKRAREAVSARTRLTVGSAAFDINEDVELILAGGHHERLTNHHGVFALDEILGKVFSVNDDFSGALAQKNARYGSFSSTGTDSEILNHLDTP